eukprot:Hpha_TRINITY_DN15565_c7_g1::TRINITY_DN15565_c7_g1_i1::g.108060::m.108060
MQVLKPSSACSVTAFPIPSYTRDCEASGAPFIPWSPVESKQWSKLNTFSPPPPSETITDTPSFPTRTAPVEASRRSLSEKGRTRTATTTLDPSLAGSECASTDAQRTSPPLVIAPYPTTPSEIHSHPKVQK